MSWLGSFFLVMKLFAIASVLKLQKRNCSWKCLPVVIVKNCASMNLICGILVSTVFWVHPLWACMYVRKYSLFIDKMLLVTCAGKYYIIRSITFGSRYKLGSKLVNLYCIPNIKMINLFGGNKRPVNDQTDSNTKIWYLKVWSCTENVWRSFSRVLYTKKIFEWS